MHRRNQGLLLLALALLAALLVPNLGSRSVPGLPRAAAIPGPPTVGDCLLTPLSSSFEPSTGRRLWSGSPAYGPCDGERIGEVALLEPGRDNRPRARSVAYRPGEACDAAATAFVGLPAELADGGRVFDSWFPAVGLSTVRLAPDPVQWAAGQRWAACLVLVPGDSPGSTTSDTSLRDAFPSATLPQDLGTCWDIDDPVFSRTVPCGSSHAAEAFGFADDLGGTTQESLDASCRKLVDLLTAMPDATAGGLRVGAAVVPDESDGRAGFAVCRVAAPPDRALTGTLLGLGTHEIPWR